MIKLIATIGTCKITLSHLKYAIIMNRTDISLWLLEKYLNKPRRNIEYLFHLACDCGLLEGVKMMIERGAGIHHYNNFHSLPKYSQKIGGYIMSGPYTAFTRALINNQSEVAIMLLEKGAIIDKVTLIRH